MGFDDSDNDGDHLYVLPSIDSLYQQTSIDQPEEVSLLGDKVFEENLANTLPENVLRKIAGDLVGAIDDDLLARKDWESGLKDSLEQLGMKPEKMEFPFPHACGIYSSIMMQTLVEFCASATNELLPLEGPVKELIIGEVNEEIEEKSKRVELFANYFFTQMAPEFYSDFKKMLPWVGLTGMAIRKVYYDPIMNRPTSKFFKAQDFIVNYGTSSLSDCWRMTEVVHMNAMTFERYKKMGIYRDINISPLDESDEQSEFESTLDRVEGQTRPQYDLKTDYELYEVHTYLDINEIEELDSEPNTVTINSSYRPYCITIHKDSQQVLSMYRNWDENDEEFKRKNCYIDYGFIEGISGFYKLGAAQLIGGISSACTTLLRQYIDGMTLSNFPGGMHIKGLRLEDNNIRIGPTEFIPVDTGGLPIQDAIMLMPYKEPSQTINEMRKELENAAARIMGAANAQMGEFNPNAPVGTTFALLDVINLTQSVVIRGLRDSFAEEIKLFYNLFAKTVPEEGISFDTQGSSGIVRASDFLPSIKLVPLADPHVTTKMQRLMRAQSIVDLSNQSPDLYDRREVQLLYLKEIKLPETQINKLLPDKNNIPSLDPVSENMNIMMQKPVKAYIDQDHKAHNIVHQNLLVTHQNDQGMVAAINAHMAQHNAFMFQLEMQQAMNIQIPEKPEEVPFDVQNRIAIMAAQVIQQQEQENPQQPQQPLDPAAVMLEDVKVKAMAVEQKKASDELRAQTESFKAQLQNEAKMKELEIKIMEIQEKIRSDELAAQTRAFSAQLDYQAKLKEKRNLEGNVNG